jgi:hypothetical protein
MNNDAYGRTVSFSTDGTTDSYTVGESQVFNFPAGTPTDAAYLGIAIGKNIEIFQAAVSDYALNAYSYADRFTLLALYHTAQAAGLTNRQAYIFQVMLWAEAVTAYALSYISAVKALTDPTIVVATAPDFSTITPQDPLITPLAAMAIST